MRYYSPAKLRQIKRHLRNGGVIAYPTESCYGFGCDPFNYSAINKIIRLKGRNKAKGMIVIAGGVAQLQKVIKPLNSTEKPQLTQYWPGFYSIILPVSRQIPRNLIGSHRKIAVRVTRHKLVKQLTCALHMPLVSTSANKSGHQSIKTYRECVRQFGKRVMVLSGATNFAKKPSTIIDWESKKTLR
jgi:L-threonylcarbamoyladenylate synthase